MSLRSLAKSVAFAFLGSPPVVARRLRRLAGSGALTVLCLHRVAPADGSTYPPLDPMLFRELLHFCRRHFAITTFAGLDQRDDVHRPAAKPPMVMTFDDGYKDFIDYAVPILDELGLACNHNLIPRAIDTGRPPFNVILNDYAGMAPDDELVRLDVPGFRSYRRGEPRYAWGNALSTWFKERPMAEQSALAAAIEPQLARWDAFRPTPVMSLEEARQIAAVHEIGAHSFEHANLGRESDEYVTDDALRCRAWFHERMGLEPSIFAVPNGDYREHQLDLIEAAGFSRVLLVGQCFSSPASRRNHRFNFDASSGAEVRFKAMGGLAAIGSGEETGND